MPTIGSSENNRQQLLVQSTQTIHAEQADHCHRIEMAVVIGDDDGWPLQG